MLSNYFFFFAWYSLFWLKLIKKEERKEKKIACNWFMYSYKFLYRGFCISNNNKIYHYETFFKIKFPIQKRSASPPLYMQPYATIQQLSCFFRKNTRNRIRTSLGLRYITEEVDYQNVLCNDPRRERFFFVSKWRRQWKSIMARDQKTFAGGNVTISIFVADFSISVPRHDRQISSTGSSPPFSSFFLFLALLAWPLLENISSPPMKLLSRAVFYPSATIIQNWASPFVPCSLVANRRKRFHRLRKRMELNPRCLFAIVSFAKSRVN